MKNRTLPRILLALAAVGLLSGFTRCGHHREIDAARIERGAERIVEDVADEVDASDAQTEQMRGLAKRLTPQVLPIVKGHRALKSDLQKAWSEPAPERAPLHAELDAQLDRVESLLHDALDVALDLHGLLTPEQREEIAEEWD